MHESTYVISEKKAPDILRWVMSSEIDLLALANENQVIPVAGGDGTVLYSIHNLWHLGLPFFGIDRGTKGFLLNPEITTPAELVRALKNFYCIELSLLEVIFETENGKKISMLAFNDVYLNVEPGTVCYGRIWGESYPEKLFGGDGVIICTPQGSTAYNKVAGGSVLPLKEDLLGIRTICSPQSIREVIDKQVINVEIFRGKMTAHADSERVDNVVRLQIYPSGKNVMLAFVNGYNFEAKRYLK